jgi:hypothetical protein
MDSRPRIKKKNIFEPPRKTANKLLPLIFDILKNDSATLQSTQWIINAHYNLRLFRLRDETTKYEANTCVAHFFFCNHNICGSGPTNKTLALIV